MDLATDDRAQSGHDVAANAAAADHHAEALTLAFPHSIARDVLGRDDQHGSLLESQAQCSVGDRESASPGWAELRVLLVGRRRLLAAFPCFEAGAYWEPRRHRRWRFWRHIAIRKAQPQGE